METKDEKDSSRDWTNTSRRNVRGEWWSTQRLGSDAVGLNQILKGLYGIVYNLIMHSISAKEKMLEIGGSKWNFAEKRWKNGKNGLCNPLIFREIPRNYGCGRINFFVRYGKSGHLSFKEGAQFAAIRTSQVVDFWRNLAYSHKKTEGGHATKAERLGSKHRCEHHAGFDNREAKVGKRSPAFHFEFRPCHQIASR